MRKRLLAVFLELSILLSILLIAVIHGGAIISFITLLVGAISFPISLYLISISLDELADILDVVIVVIISICFYHYWDYMGIFYFPANKFIGFIDTLG